MSNSDVVNSSNSVGNVVKGSKAYTLLFSTSLSNNDPYWLASLQWKADDDYVSYGLRRVINCEVNNYALVRSNCTSNGTSNGVRAVITLDSTVNLDGNSTDGWNIL